MYSTEFLNDENYASKPQRNNRLLIESENLDEYDDGFTRNRGGGGGQLLAPAPQLQRRNAAPLIEEEMPESQPHFMRRPQANLARQIYDRKQAAKKPWKKGMPYSQSTLDTFDKSTPYDRKMFGGIRNPRQAVNLEANRPGGFQKLFGAKMSKDELAERRGTPREPKKSFWGRLKNAVTGGGRKRSWMEMFFGARRRGAENTPGAMGITSTKAPMGQSSGWADQLVDAGIAGNLGEGRDADPQVPADPGPQQAVEEQPAHKSYEDYIEEEEKVPAPSKQPLLTAKQAKHNSFMGTMYAMQQLNAMDKPDGNGNPHDTIDDNSIDQSEDGDEGYDKGGLYNQNMLNAFMRNGDDAGDGDDEPTFVQDHIMSLFSKK